MGRDMTDSACVIMQSCSICRGSNDRMQCVLTHLSWLQCLFEYLGTVKMPSGKSTSAKTIFVVFPGARLEE